MTRRGAVWLGLVAVLCGGTATGVADARVPRPAIEPARGEKCIAPPEVMRRDHMDLLRHQRDDTVRGGIRGAKASLQGCIECHAGKATGSVAAAKTDFCVSCHAYAGVKLDCFECHATRPKGTARKAGQ